jgi:ABC-type uncharacterized transport system substrate-binding protein
MFPWRKAVAIVMVIAAVIYASQHPHSFFYYVLKVILAPIP